MNLTSQFKMFALTLVASSLVACGNDATTTSTTTGTTTTVEGQAIAGAVTGNLTVKDASDNQIATATVTNGQFSVEITNTSLGQALTFEVTGTYTDEVSGSTVTLDAANPMALIVAANQYTAGTTGNAPVTPDTSIIAALVKGGKTLTQAEATFQSVFGYKPNLAAKPFDPYTATQASADAYSNEASFRAGMFSQLGADLGLTAADLAAMPNKIAADLDDGLFDGKDNLGNPVVFSGANVDMKAKHATQPLGTLVTTALSKFAGSAANKAGLTPPNMGLPPIVDDAPGKIKSITLADGITVVNVSMDSTYTAPFQPGFRATKTTHVISLTDASGQPYTAANSLMVMPKMYMNAGHQHGTPHAMAMNTAPGEYTVDMYYLMPSGMNGMLMGTWELDVQVGDPTSASMMDPYAHAFFYPNVMMNMGSDVLMNKVNNTADTWTNMMGVTNPREYRVWLHSVTGTSGSHVVTVFVSTQNMANMTMGGGMAAMAHSPMTFPAVDTGMTLQGPLANMTRPDQVVANVTVTIGGFTATALGGGQYQAPLGTLTSGTPATIEVGLSVGNNAMTVGNTMNNASLSFTAP